MIWLFLSSLPTVSVIYGFEVEGTGSDDPHRASSSIGPVDILAVLKVCSSPEWVVSTNENYNSDMSLIVCCF